MTVPVPSPLGGPATWIAARVPARPVAARPGPLPALVLALAFSGALSGCGDSTPSAPGGGPNPPPPDPSGPTPPTTPTPAPTPLPAVLGSPCPGVVVRSDPPTSDGGGNQVELALEWENRSRGSILTWTGPYATDDIRDPDNPPRLEIGIARWTVETTTTLTRHTFAVGWPASKELVLDLGAGSSGCQAPTVVCLTSGCELRRQ